MGTQLHMHSHATLPFSPLNKTLISSPPLSFFSQRLQHNRAFGLAKNVNRDFKRRRDVGIVVASSSSNVALWESWKPEKGAKSPSLSDVVWPCAGAFAAMAALAKIDQVLASKGLFITIAPLGAVCAVLFATPSSPGARKYNMFMAQIGCAAIGVLAFSVFGPGWLARSAGLAAAIAFMILTGAVHPPAASLPILFIDVAKMQQLNFWYALFPGAAGCILLCLIQEVVMYLKNNFKF
ncbi:uncharacterized protein LOC108195021 [Daucus carota subsp. sativus]|uniref:HPP transmembrane region domain-containing protein n=1 Tax=Daucus carota subsp. sativus TaxID=79200 RepID=A0A161ZNI3_DAUCS